MTLWQPGHDWTPIAGTGGAATVGVWRTRRNGSAWIVKRIERADDDVGPRSHRWWRREIEVASSGISRDFRGLIAPDFVVEEDEGGATLWSPEIEKTSIPGGIVAEALGRFAATELSDPGWFVIERLRDRVSIADTVGLGALPESMVETDATELIHAVWARRSDILQMLDALPQVMSHGDALPRNEAVEDLLARYLVGMGSGADMLRPARQGLSLTTSLIAISRAIRTAGTPQFNQYSARLHTAMPELRLTLDVLYR